MVEWIALKIFRAAFTHMWNFILSAIGRMTLVTLEVFEFMAVLVICSNVMLVVKCDKMKTDQRDH